MVALAFHPLIEVTSDVVLSVRESFNLDEDTVQKDIDDIIQWWEKQEHLVEVLPHIKRETIERFLILSLGSVETCKRKIDKLLTMRGLLPEIVLNKSSEEFEDFLDNVFLLPLPKLNPVDHTRVSILDFTTEDYQDFDFNVLLRFVFLNADFRTYFDYKFSDRYILDLKNFKMHMLVKLNPITLKKGLMLIVDTYGVKVKGIHIINAPTFIDKLVFILKQCFKEKIANRIYVHNSIEEIYEIINKEILPEEYGGVATSCKTLREKWREYLRTEEAQQVLHATNKFYSNESRRSSIQFNEEYLGMPGSFKQLNVD